MPGVVMDNASVGGTGPEPSIHEPKPGLSSSSQGAGNPETSADLRNGATHVNGISKESGELRAKSEPSTSQKPPELVHITQGFFPFSELVNRSVQQCWNDLSDLITELAEMQVSPHDQSSLSIPANGKSPGNQSSGNVHKKLRILDFAHAKRAEFIKILVLSQWSRQAADVSQLIDLQGFIRTRHQAYVGALQWIGDMKRDLVRAQVANPDLKTALEVLSKGKVVAMSDLGYKPPKPLTAKRTLKKLQKLNRIISVRLALHDKVPRAFRTYRVHDGRVTFFVPGEFELDLSVGEESIVSQFFFVDIRFLFSPSCAVPKGRVFNELDIKVNDTLRDDGLQGCFDLLHGLILTNKINILFKQATDLARGLWSDVLRVELLHRTLIVQYWALKPGSKSWLEVGIKRGCRGGSNHGIPYLGLRWMQDGQEVDNTNIEFDTENLSIESVLRSVIALHVSHILSSVYTNIGAHLLFSTGALSLRAQLSRTEPGDCQLNVQLTASRHLCATIEPMSGASILSATPSILDRSDGDRSPDKSPTDDMISRIARVRCFSAIEEIESNVRMLGFETVNPRSLKFDVRRIFPSNVMRFSLFSHRLWERSWMVAATSSMDSDNWWVVQLRPTLAAENHPTSATGAQSTSMLPSAQVISSKLLIAQQQMSYASFADLGHCLTGIVAIHANAQSLAELHSIHFCPPLQKLQLEVGLRTPDIFLRYEASNLPPALRMASPTGLKKPYVKDTVRLAFQGVDPHQKLAIIVAYGSLSIPVKSLGALISKWDRSLVFQQKGDGFAIRLLALAGHAIIIDLIEELQRLERVLSIIESLQRKKMELRSLSLSRITFAYGPEKDLYGSININISKPSSADVDLVSAASKTDSLFLLRLGIAFDHPNPHRRIQESLAVALNNTSTDIGLDSFFELLSLTLPLLRVLDQITVNPSRNQALKVQVTVRNSKTFHIHYPAPKFRFQLTSGQHLYRMTWILKDVSGIQDRSRQSQLVDRVQERLYNSKGDGWRGLGNGVVADVDKVSNLILELDSCFVGVQSDPDMSVPKSKADHDASSGNQQHTVTKGGFEPASRAGMPPDGGGSTAGAVSRKPEHKADVPEDVIMID